MSRIAKRVKLRENSKVEFELDGRVVIGTLLMLEGGNVAVRYGSGKV